MYIKKNYKINLQLATKYIFLANDVLICLDTQYILRFTYIQKHYF